jgi:hypothetical protein
MSSISRRVFFTTKALRHKEIMSVKSIKCDCFSVLKIKFYFTSER